VGWEHRGLTSIARPSLWIYRSCQGSFFITSLKLRVPSTSKNRSSHFSRPILYIRVTAPSGAETCGLFGCIGPSSLMPAICTVNVEATQVPDLWWHTMLDDLRNVGSGICGKERMVQKADYMPVGTSFDHGRNLVIIMQCFVIPIRCINASIRVKLQNPTYRALSLERRRKNMVFFQSMHKIHKTSFGKKYNRKTVTSSFCLKNNNDVKRSRGSKQNNDQVITELLNKLTENNTRDHKK
jgi:hypothetical protein